MERMERKDDESEESQSIVSKNNYREEMKWWENKTKERVARKQVEKKESLKKTTLNEILRLKQEIEEVNSTLGSLDVSRYKSQLESKRRQTKQELEDQLKGFEKRIFQRDLEEAAEENKLDSLRQAYQASSSDEDGPNRLTQRILTKQKADLERLRESYKKAVPETRVISKAGYKGLAWPWNTSDEEGCPVPQKAHPRQERSGGCLIQERPFNEDSEEFSGNEASQEEIPRTGPGRRPLGMQGIEKPSVATKYDDVELMKAKRTIEKKVGGFERGQFQDRPEVIRLNDDYYDDNFLSMVYEMESNRHESTFN